METVANFISWAPKSLQTVTAAMKSKDTCSLEEKLRKLDSILKSRDITLPTKVYIVKVMFFPIVMYKLCELDHNEGWTPKNWRFWIVVLKKTLKSPLDNEEIKLVNPKGDQPWVFIGKTDAEADAPNFGHLMQWKRLWYSERLRAAGEGGGWGWDGWMASPTQWTWVWANSERPWRTGKPGMLQPMGSQRVGHNLVTEQQQQSLQIHKYSLQLHLSSLFHFFIGNLKFWHSYPENV